MKELKIAKECLKRAIKEKNEKHRDSLMFQFCLQMARFCENLGKRRRNKEFKKYAEQFRTFSKLYRLRRWLDEKSLGSRIRL